MLALINFDAPAGVLLEELLAEGLLPAFASVQAQATRISLETPSTLLTASAYPSMWSGQSPAQHGIYYPFQWVAEEQRVRFVGELERPESVWERASRQGLTSVVVDAYESRAPDHMKGAFVGGWQFANRTVLPRVSVPANATRSVGDRLSPGSAVEEVFGRPTARGLTRILLALLEAPVRAADLALALMRACDPDLLVLGLPVVHLGGHQLLDPGAVLGRAAPPELARGLRDVYVAADRALGRVVEALPTGADLIVMTPHGMGPNTSRSELTNAMVGAILDPATPRREVDRAQRLRLRVPVPARAQVARMLPARTALALASRLSTPHHDWSRTRAFAVPSDAAGLVRVNLRGREREGILTDVQAGEVLEELEAGLATFELPSGEPAVRSTHRVHDTIGPGEKVSMLPDLAIVWTDTPPDAGEVLSSPRFGTVGGTSIGSGRSGNHNDEAWALVAPGRSTLLPPVRPWRLTDIAATVGATLGMDEDGESMLGRG